MISEEKRTTASKLQFSCPFLAPLPEFASPEQCLSRAGDRAHWFIKQAASGTEITALTMFANQAGGASVLLWEHLHKHLYARSRYFEVRFWISKA